MLFDYKQTHKHIQIMLIIKITIKPLKHFPLSLSRSLLMIYIRTKCILIILTTGNTHVFKYITAYICAYNNVIHEHYLINFTWVPATSTW